jgi:aryl-alcohol dehydrogenase-like predicted oxidoreductase
MKYTQLGNTDLKISQIVMGCWGIGGGYTWGEADEKVSIATIQTAIDQGINILDTAEFYSSGYSEEVVGKALKGRRDKMLIATKVWVDNMSADGIVTACDGSLKRMQTDYVDIYQIHWPNREIPLEETLTAIEQLKKAGKIRAIGVCNHGVQDISAALEISDLVFNQMAYSLLFRAIEFEILPKCLDSNLGVMAYSPMAQGLLTGIFHAPEDVDDERARLRFYSKDRPGTVHDEDGYEREVFEAVANIRAVCEEIGEPMADVALAWGLHQPGVIAALAGARQPKEIIEDAKAAELELSDSVVERLNSITEKLKAAMGSNADPWRTKSRIR